MTDRDYLPFHLFRSGVQDELANAKRAYYEEATALAKLKRRILERTYGLQAEEPVAYLPESVAPNPFAQESVAPLAAKLPFQ